MVHCVRYSFYLQKKNRTYAQGYHSTSSCLSLDFSRQPLQSWPKLMLSRWLKNNISRCLSFWSTCILNGTSSHQVRSNSHINLQMKFCGGAGTTCIYLFTCEPCFAAILRMCGAKPKTYTIWTSVAKFKFIVIKSC